MSGQQVQYSYVTRQEAWPVPPEAGVYPGAYEQYEHYDPNANATTSYQVTSGPITVTTSSRQVTSESEV
jgi:hypothetical protein